MKGHGPSIHEKVIAGLVLLLFIKGFPYSFLFKSSQDDLLVESQFLARIYWIFVFCLILVLVLPRIKRVLTLLLSNPTLLILVSLPIFSILWSISPVDTLRRSIVLLGTTSFGLYLAERFRVMDFLKLLTWGLSINMVISWILGLALPDIGTMSYGGESVWRGVFGHKNPLGMFMLLNIIVLLFLIPGSNGQKWILWITVLLSMGLLVLSNSKTPLIIGMVLIVIYILVRFFRGRSPYAVAAFSLCAMWLGLIALLLSLNIEQLLLAAGRELTLTGRGQIWIEVWEMIQSNFWLGYGYKAFWLVETGPVTEVWRKTGWPMLRSSHNGILELWLGLGVWAVAIFLLLFHKSYFNALYHIRSDFSQERIWTIIFLSFFFLLNITESYILGQHSLIWILFVFSITFPEKHESIS